MSLKKELFKKVPFKKHALLTQFSLTLTLLMLLVNQSVLASTTISDDLQTHHFETPPTRIIAINWSMAENLLELGITPIAITDIKGYRQWVVNPPIPDSVLDIGTRSEPNLERIKELNPDLILSSALQKGLVPQLQKIAPTLYYDSFREDHNNAEKAQQIFTQIALVTGKQKQAQQRLQQQQDQIKKLKEQLITHFNGQLPKVSLIRFANPTAVIIYGDNSLSSAALDKLGIQSALTMPKTKWGFKQFPTSELAKIKEGVVLHIEPFEHQPLLDKSPLWNILPFVKNKQFSTIDSTWSYGGINAVGYTAQAVTKSLLAFPIPAPSLNNE
ncbi:iron-siderophore ABC transporter substrate-binding protein [Psychromonas sp. Urea-02u-13]|uniref:iron-siderophore ABC transporter substrate-binding protein n=1 Tax=Psychromonas sp. Urea-02u-13 TaxID=2058326 RepID=UPI000C34717A|nr:iron-siderophore ABC transporter substrate-binding protein [Psychromonas sp. Urea-02u-13]PKG38977.1 iron-hydroxamate ABC transporter substrate-binding protein [Psychromonas sp. Urea-02u-13]